MLFKAGIRIVGWTGRKEKELEKWSLFKDQVNTPLSFRDLASADELAKDPAAGVKKMNMLATTMVAARK